jgi:hypothetical protein
MSIFLFTKEHCGLNACFSKKKLADYPTCERGRSDETVLHVLLRCDKYAEARKALREAAGDNTRQSASLIMKTDESSNDLHIRLPTFAWAAQQPARPCVLTTAPFS